MFVSVIGLKKVNKSQKLKVEKATNAPYKFRALSLSVFCASSDWRSNIRQTIQCGYVVEDLERVIIRSFSGSYTNPETSLFYIFCSLLRFLRNHPFVILF